MLPEEHINYIRRGSTHHGAILKEQDVVDILKMSKNGFRSKTLAALYNVSRSNISYIISNRIWQHIDRNNYTIKMPTCRKKRIPTGHHTKLSHLQVLEILDSLEMGVKQEYLASLYGVSSPTISNINCGIIWKHIPRSEKLLARTLRPRKEKKRTMDKNKLTTEQVVNIRDRLERGEKQLYIAALYSVSQSTISSIASRYTWKNI